MTFVRSDSVAQDQLRAFVEALRRPGIDTPAQLAVAIGDRDARHEHALGRLLDFDRHAPIAIQRAVVAASELLGISTETAFHRIKTWNRRGSFAGAIKALSWLPGTVWPVDPLTAAQVGYVYGMQAVDFTGIVKVGFSLDPERRLRDLQSAHKINLELVTAVPGTYVDESIIHHAMRLHSLANEWFDLDGRWQSSFPVSLFLKPQRMWLEMAGAE